LDSLSFSYSISHFASKSILQFHREKQSPVPAHRNAFIGNDRFQRPAQFAGKPGRTVPIKVG
jgi:hypothetical protein